MKEKYLGITACDECGARMRVPERYKGMIGKPARCPKCKNIFTIQLVDATPLENVAMTNDDQTTGEDAEKSRRRRTKAEIKQDHIDVIREGFRKLHPRLVQVANAERASEEEVRRWCVDVLTTALGYKHDEINTEVKVLSQRVDIALQKNGKIFLIIECKNIRSRLNTNTRDQAACYATNLAAEWIVTTNGQIWKLYKVIPRVGEEPRFLEIFDIALLDEDGVSDSDAESLYLLTSRAVFCGDLDAMSNLASATSKKRVLKALESDRVLKALRLELADSHKEQTGSPVKITDQDAATGLQDGGFKLQVHHVGLPQRHRMGPDSRGTFLDAG